MSRLERMTVPPELGEGAAALAVGTAAGGAERTFLIADVRGYTTFTQRRGDEAAARLAGVFAGLARDVVEARGGRVTELRGDEALAVFSSPAAAVRAASELVAACAEGSEEDPELPLPVGVGIDVGRAETSAAWEAHACAVAGRNLTREEWRRFVNGHSYTTVCPKGH